MDSLLLYLETTPVASPLPFALNTKPCLHLDLGTTNASLRGVDPGNTQQFSRWVNQQIKAAGAAFAAGGYGENRTLYAMSEVFRSTEENRTLHLGIDLWLAAGTPIHAALEGTVHSTRANDAFGDYGPTIILEHGGPGGRFYTLHGHLSHSSLQMTQPGQHVDAGQQIGWLGEPHENVGWPPHLHFQIIRDMQGRSGDYPGVCKFSEKEIWLKRCPDPNLVLRIKALGSGKK